MDRIVRQHGVARWRNQKADLVQSDHVSRGFSGRHIQKCDAPAVFRDGIADQGSRRMIRHEDPFEEISRNHIAFEPNGRFAGHRHAVIVIVDEIADQHGLRIGELHAGRFTSADGAVLNMDVLNLLSEEHAVDADVMEHDAFPVEDTHRMTAMFANGEAADFNVSRAVGPFTDMKDPHPLASEHRDFFDPRPDQAKTILAVNSDIFRILSGLNMNRVAGLGFVNGVLDRFILTAAVQGNRDRARLTRILCRLQLLARHRERTERHRQKNHGGSCEFPRHDP